jgi:GNAT superfamily N-acetyltransferase
MRTDAELSIAVCRYDDPRVTALVETLQGEYVQRYGGPDDDATTAAEFTPPGGLFILAERGDVPVAMGGWRAVPDDPGAVELKRMYVVSAERRTGLARVVLAELEERARSSGAARVVLCTGDRQPEAVMLYESCGYRQIEGFGHYRGAPRALFYEKPL